MYDDSAQDDGAQDGGAQDDTAGVGSAAEEASRLVGALRDLVSGPAAEHLATGSTECQVCPFCRAVALLRDSDPQAVGRAAEGLVSMVSAAAALAEPFLRSMVDTAVSAAQAATAPDRANAPTKDTDGDEERRG